MGNLVQLIRGMVQEELSEMADKGAPSLAIKVTDLDKAERVKKLHSGHWVGKLMDLIIKSGENGITRGKIADILGMKPEKLNTELMNLQDSGIISRGRLTPVKPEKTPGQRGRKVDPNSRTGKVTALRQKFKDDENYQPTDDDITFKLQKGFGNVKLSQDDIDQIKASALGLTKRGRPKMQKESLYEAFKRLQNLKNG